MEQNLTRKWIEEIRTQCRFAAYAWQHMRRSLIGMDNDKSFLIGINYQGFFSFNFSTIRRLTFNGSKGPCSR